MERLRRVAEFDLGPERRRYITRRAEATEAQAIEVEREFRRYCAIVALGDGAFGMSSPEVDDFWHEAILCGSLYREWCQAMAGRFIHHDPSEDDESGLPLAVDVPACRTWNAYVAAFKSEPPADLWPRPIGLDGMGVLTATEEEQADRRSFKQGHHPLELGLGLDFASGSV